MEQLITASIGLYKDGHGVFYVQIITADAQNNYLVPVSREQAVQIKKENNLSIELLPPNY